MTFKYFQWGYLFPILFLILSSPCLAQEEFSSYPGLIHIHTYISGSQAYPFRKVVSLAQDKGIKILAFTDTFLRRWEYGLPIFSNILKVSVEEDSAVKYGIRRYLQDLKRIKEASSEMLILEGVEVTPFYWWSGNHFKKNLTLNDYNRHLLVIGLKKPQDYAHLPVVGNRYFLPQLKDIPFLLLPISLIILGIFILKRRKQSKFLGLALNVLGILFVFNFLPFSASRYNPYFGQKQFLPYQALIDYVSKKGGLVFWAHPEVTESVSSGKLITIRFFTSSYPEALMLTSGYTGFGVNLLNPNPNLILPGREWDNALISYCQGKRSKPAWVINESDYRGNGPIDAIQNIFLLSELKPEALYEALSRGRLYIRSYSENNINVVLDNFNIGDSQKKENSKLAFMGDEIEIKGKPRLCIKGSYMINPLEALKIDIIRNGEIIKEFEFTPLEKTHPIRENSLTGFTNERVFDLDFQDDSLELDRKSYYRLIFSADGKIVLVTNPIFVKIKNG